MAERVLDRVMAIADRLREQAAEAERLGRLPDETVKDLKSVGVIRLLQPKQYNGFEVHPREFAETVMAVASLDPASGWICGVVGGTPIPTRLCRSAGTGGDLGRRHRHLGGLPLRPTRRRHAG